MPYVTKSQQKERRRSNYAKAKAKGVLTHKGQVALLSGEVIERTFRGASTDLGEYKRVPYKGQRILVEAQGQENGIHYYQQVEES